MATKDDISTIREDMATKDDISTIRDNMAAIEGRIKADIDDLKSLIMQLWQQKPPES